MSRQMDALLSFTDLARVGLRPETVDLSAVAHTVAKELKMSDPERRITFRITDGFSVEGDAGLLKTVLDNLLGNAWKYTGTREEAIIEFGVMETDGTQSYFVRDNGVGFDMKSAGELFTAFNYLPGCEEYRGFGVGLAKVDRIIRRHGGQVWAESEPDRGATFYFTLQLHERNERI